MWHVAGSCGDRDRPGNPVISHSHFNYSCQSVREADSVRCSVKKVFLKISQNSQNTCARVSFLIKLQAKTCNFIKMRSSATGVSL